MSTKSFTSLRRYTGHALTMMLFCAAIGRAAEAQVTPTVVPSYVQALTPPSGLGTVDQMVVDSFGDLLVNDAANGALYEYPAGGGAVVTLLPPNSMGSQNPGIAIDSTNAIYLEGNWSNTMGRFPYDAATKSWDGLDTISAANGNTSQNICPTGSGTPAAPYGFACGDTPNTSPYYFQPWAITTDANGNVIVDAQNGNFIFEIPVTYSGTTATAQQANSVILSASAARAQSIATDKFGNIYFVEEIGQKGALPGVLMIPAGSTGLTSDAGLTRVDPNLPDVTGVTTDANGNLYVSDGKQGVYLIPNPSGTPQTSSAVLLTPLPASGQVAIDATRGILYVPNSQNGEQIYAVTFNSVSFGKVAVGSSSAAATIMFAFNSSVTTTDPVIFEAASSTPDFKIASGGTCAGNTQYAAGSGCSINVTFNPLAVGGLSAKLIFGDAGTNVGAMLVSGTGVGSAVQLSPGTQTTLNGSLTTPGQMAIDPFGNVYVADAGVAGIQIFSKTSALPGVYTNGLVSPTGVAVDGAGDMFVGDSGNGSLIEVPVSSTGAMPAWQTTLKTGLGTHLQVAVDSADDVYVSDPDNGRVVKLSNVGVTVPGFGQTETDITGFTAPSAIAVDASNNLYVADGSNLIEVAPDGTKTTLLSSLGAVSGLWVDPSGSVYVAQAGGTVRIPNENGTLNAADETQIATSVTSPTSVVLDRAQDIYVADSVAKDVVEIASSATVDFGTLSSATATASSTYTIVNDGNAPLNITGFGGTADYSGSSSDCAGAPIAISGTCSVTVTFSPGPGDQGTLTGEVVVQSDAANSPVGVTATGVGAALAASTTTIAVNSPTVNGAPTTITVAPASGTSPTPTGQVTLTVTGNGITPVVMNGTLSNGSVTLTPTNLAAGTYQFAASYQGDRAYGGSTASASATIGAGAVALQQPTMAQVQSLNPYYPYVLSSQSGSDEPYDGSVTQFVQTAYYTVTVVPTDGQPLIGQPVYDSNGKLIGSNYGSVTFQGAPAATCAPIAVHSDGTAQFDPSCLTIDTSNSSIPNILSTYTVTPVYSPTGAGDAASYTNPNYTAFTGTAINYTALRNPMVAISANPGSLSVSKGSSASATLTLTSILGYGVAGAGGLLNNYSLPVQLSCDGLPAYATCTFVYPNPDPSDPQSVHVGPATGTVLSVEGSATGPCTVAQGCTGPGTVIMTITTNVPTGVAKLETRPTSEVFLAMLGLGVLGLGFGRKRSVRARIGTLAAIVLCCGIMAGAAGCSSTQLGGNSAQVTPAGTYTVQVTAKEVGSQTISATPGITYGNANQMSLPFTMQVTIQ